MPRRTSDSTSEPRDAAPRRRSARTAGATESTSGEQRREGQEGAGRGAAAPATSSRDVIGSSTSLGVGHPERGTSARRSSRRASLDPYQVSREGSPETARRVSRPSREQAVDEYPGRASDDATMREERASIDETEDRRRSVASVSTEAAQGKNFRLVILQQPEIGAEAGMGKVTLGRLPVVPATIVQLIVTDPAGERIDAELPYLFCSCSLRGEDGVSPVELARPPEQSTSTATSERSETDEEFSALVGNLVRGAHQVRDLQGEPASVFVFDDVSVRTQGRFTLEFRLGEAVRPKSPRLAAVVSDPFSVVEWKQYPGRPAADTVPELSMHLHRQGVPMYIPPLVLAQASDHPPPAGSNPFPTDFEAGERDDENAGPEVEADD
ncbi:hypothetical protein JCM10212_001335 [Sporobolomyces blumeae]